MVVDRVVSSDWHSKDAHGGLPREIWWKGPVLPAPVICHVRLIVNNV